MAVGGGDELCCRPYSAGVLHSVSDQIQNLQNCYTTPNKVTSKDDIKGIVQPFELGGETTLIRSAVKYWKAGMFLTIFLMIPSHERSIKPFSAA